MYTVFWEFAGKGGIETMSAHYAEFEEVVESLKDCLPCDTLLRVMIRKLPEESQLCKLTPTPKAA